MVLAVLGSFFLARFNEHYRTRREHLSRAVDALRAQLETLLRISSEYWASKHDAKVSPSQEAEIEFRLSDVTTLALLCGRELWRDQGSEGPGLVSRLMGSVVTEEFGKVGRKPDPTRARAIASAAAELAAVLSQSRMDYLYKAPFWRGGRRNH
jgi:hypothetical protein